jgi:hypothetical protein
MGRHPELDDFSMNDIGVGLGWCANVYVQSFANSQLPMSSTVAGMTPNSGALEKTFT